MLKTTVSLKMLTLKKLVVGNSKIVKIGGKKFAKKSAKSKDQKLSKFHQLAKSRKKYSNSKNLPKNNIMERINFLNTKC